MEVTVREDLQIYRLVPVASPDDPHQRNRPLQGEVIVRALTTDDARLAANSAELHVADVDALAAEGKSTDMARSGAESSTPSYSMTGAEIRTLSSEAWSGLTRLCRHRSAGSGGLGWKLVRESLLQVLRQLQESVRDRLFFDLTQ
jgi:hypothetical protein